jgi:hypothetical protein
MTIFQFANNQAVIATDKKRYGLHDKEINERV